MARSFSLSPPSMRSAPSVSISAYAPSSSSQDSRSSSVGWYAEALGFRLALGRETATGTGAVSVSSSRWSVSVLGAR